MTPTELASARKRLGYSTHEMAEALRLGPNGATALREMERGKRAITGPISVAVELLSRLSEENERYRAALIKAQSWFAGYAANGGHCCDEELALLSTTLSGGQQGLPQ